MVLEKIPRPKVIGGITVKVATGCGNMYVQMGWYKGKLFEIFATLGKGGGCAMCFSESLTRSITAGLRCGMDPEEYVKQLRETRCPTPHPFPKEEAVWSCPDAIAKVIKEYGTLKIDDIISLIVDHNPVESMTADEEEAQEHVKVIAELSKARDEVDKL
jgi:ribonucleoside-diphosphate reductase alpha chain